MAKILVADDNSNIQKMVGLALKDHGIEVIAVGNGEAAVRKASDIHPDLVLADVFMPVRNGYEVCEYIKKDPALAHIPVILLVGAFDPLDEQEAQRVGADGVLKKPFVPPDPLISMVKSALVRAGVAHAGFTPAKAVPEVPVEAPAPPPPPVRSVLNFAPKPLVAAPETESESFADDVPARPAAVTFETGKQPVAFGSLLGASGAQIEEEPNEVTAVPAMEHDWRKREEDEEEGEQPHDADDKPSWRRDAGSEEAQEPEQKVASGWRGAVSDGIRGLGKRFSGWAPSREKSDLVEAAEAPEPVHGGLSDFRNIPAAPFSGEAWAAAIEASAQNKVAVAEEEHPTPPAAELERLVGHVQEAGAVEESFVSQSQIAPVPTSSYPSFVSEPQRSPEPEAQPEPASFVSSFVSKPENVPEPTSPAVSFVSELAHSASIASHQVSFVSQAESVPQPASLNEPAVVSATIAEPEKTSITPSWFSTPPSPWEAEAQKASKLASTWDTPITPAVPSLSTEDVAGSADTNSFATAPAPDEIEVVSAADTNSPLAEEIGANSAMVSQQVAQPAEIDVDVVVARVLARLSPERLQEVARDILRPVLETIIREELNSKH